MRFGIDGRKFPQASELGPEGVLRRVHELGWDGVFFRTVLDLSPALDLERLAAIRSVADERGLYLEIGLGKVNPYNTAEAPDVRAIGDGDYRLGMERMIRACHAIGCTELWADTANYQRFAWGLHANDRFRTDVDWPDQLAATERFLAKLAPLLRELGCRINLETHEEITTYELLRLIEAIGPDVLGVTLDLANVVIRGENPMNAARRVAPYVHLTHIRDVVLLFIPEGLLREIRACGDGIIDWQTVLGALAEFQPDLNLSVESVAGGAHNRIELYDPAWQAAHPDLSTPEVLDLVRLARQTEMRMRRGEMPEPDAYYPENGLDSDGQIDFIRRCHDHLRQVLRETDPTVSSESAEHSQPWRREP